MPLCEWGRPGDAPSQAASGSLSKRGLWLAAALRTHPSGRAPSPEFVLLPLALPLWVCLRPLLLLHQPPGPVLCGSPALGVWRVFREDSLMCQGLQGAPGPREGGLEGVCRAQSHLGVDAKASPAPSPVRSPSVPRNNCLWFDESIGGGRPSLSEGVLIRRDVAFPAARLLLVPRVWLPGRLAW